MKLTAHGARVASCQFRDGDNKYNNLVMVYFRWHALQSTLYYSRLCWILQFYFHLEKFFYSMLDTNIINTCLLTTNYKKGFIFKDVVDSFRVKTSKWILKGKHGISWHFNLRMRFMRYASFMHALGQCVYDAS